jgi:MFS family permease
MAESDTGYSLRGYPASFYLVVAANLFFFTSFQWTFVTLPGYIQEIGGEAAQIGLAFGLSTLSAIAVRPLIAPLIDRWGRKAALLVGAALFTLEPILYTLTATVWPFLAVRLMRGVALAAFTTAYTALAADLAPPGKRGEAVGLSGVTSNLGMLFAPAVGLWMQSKWGYDVHFLASAAIAATCLALVIPLKEERRNVAGVPGDAQFWAVARKRPVWVASWGITGLGVAYGAVLSFMPPLASERALAASGTYFTAFAAAMMAAQAAAGWLSDRLGRRVVAIPGLIVSAVAAAGVALAHTDAALLAAGAGLGLSWGLVRAGLDTAVMDAVTPQARGTALGVLYTCFDAAIGIGSFGLGIVAQTRSYAAAFYAAALWAVLALVGYAMLGRPTSSRSG